MEMKARSIEKLNYTALEEMDTYVCPPSHLQIPGGTNTLKKEQCDQLWPPTVTVLELQSPHTGQQVQREGVWWCSGTQKVVSGALTLAEVVLDVVCLSLSVAWEGVAGTSSLLALLSVRLGIALVGPMAPIIPAEEGTIPAEMSVDDSVMIECFAEGIP